MFSSTSSNLLPQDIIANLHFPRRLLLQFYHTQEPTPTPNYQINPSSTTKNHLHFDANLIMVITILLCALICSLCVNFLIKCVLRCANFFTREPNYYIYTCNNGLNMGMNKRLLRSFPLVKYPKDQGKIQVFSTQCVICLSEYRKGDKLRIIPKCNHGFHVKCIDKWLKSHSSCPTCRGSLVDTCQKIIGCDHQQAVGVMPQEREDFVRDYRG